MFVVVFVNLFLTEKLLFIANPYIYDRWKSITLIALKHNNCEMKTGNKEATTSVFFPQSIHTHHNIAVFVVTNIFKK